MPDTAPLRLYNLQSPLSGPISSIYASLPSEAGTVAFRKDFQDLRIGLVVPSTAGKQRLYDFVDPAGMTIELSIGALDQPASSGTFSGKSGADATGLATLAFDISAAALATALNLNPGVTTGGQTVAVTKLDSLNWVIEWSGVGAKTLLEFDATNLAPECVANCWRDQAGDGTHREVQVLRIAQQPYSANATWYAAIVSSSAANPTVITTSSPHGLVTGDVVAISRHTGSTPALNGSQTATVTSDTTFTVPVNVTVAGTGGYYVATRVAQVQTGDATRPSVQRISLAPDPYDGNFLLGFGRANVVQVICKADTGAVKEVSAIYAQADLAVKEVSSLLLTAPNTSHVLHNHVVCILSDASGPVQIVASDGSSAVTVPPLTTGRTLTVTIANNDTAATIAAAIKNALNSDGAWAATVSSTRILVTDAAYGVRTAIALDTDSGFGFDASWIGVGRVTAGVASNRHDTVAATLTDNAGPVQLLLSNGGAVATAAPAGGRRITVTFASAATAATIATAIKTALAADAQFAGATVTGVVVTAPDTNYGTRTAVATGSSGFAAQRVTAGAYGQLHNRSFTLFDESNSTCGIYLTETGAAPPSGHAVLSVTRFLSVTIAAGASAATVAAAIAAIVDPDPDFAAASTLGVVTITNAGTGARGTADAGDSTFGVSVPVPGLSLSLAVPFDCTAAALADLLGNGFAVAKASPFAWDITSSINGAQNAFSVNGTGLQMPLILKGTRSLATAACLAACAAAPGKEGIPAIEELQLTFPGGRPWTGSRQSITLYKDLSDNRGGDGVPVPSGYPPAAELVTADPTTHVLINPTAAQFKAALGLADAPGAIPQTAIADPSVVVQGSTNPWSYTYAVTGRGKNPVEPLNGAMLLLDERFQSTDTYDLEGGVAADARVTSPGVFEPGTGLTYFRGKSRFRLSSVAAMIRVEEAPSAGTDRYATVGIWKDLGWGSSFAANGEFAVWYQHDFNTGTSQLNYNAGAGAVNIASIANVVLTPPCDLAVMVIDKTVAAWARSDGKQWRLIAAKDFSAGWDTRTSVNVPLLRPFFSGSNSNTGLKISRFAAGYPGFVGIANQSFLTFEDGTPIVDGDKAYFLCSLPAVGGGTTETLTVPCSTLAIGYVVLSTGESTITALLGTARSSKVFGDNSGCGVYDRIAKHWIIVAPTWADCNGFTGGSNAVKCALYTTTANVLKGVHVLTNGTVLTLPTAGSHWDPSLKKIGASWTLAVTEPTAQTSYPSSPFNPMICTSPDLATWTLAGRNTSHNGEGCKLLKLAGAEHLVIGTVAAPNTFQFFALDGTYQGTAALPFTSTAPAPHPNLIQFDDNGTTRVLCWTFDGAYGPSSQLGQIPYTWGNGVLLEVANP